MKTQDEQPMRAIPRNSLEELRPRLICVADHFSQEEADRWIEWFRGVKSQQPEMAEEER